jgi:hypothetical protein
LPFFFRGILPISNEEHSAAGIEVAPFNSCYFVLPHCCCDRKSDDTANWNLLLNICFQCRDNAIEFVLRGAAITLIAFSDKPETPKSNPGEIDWFSWHNDAVHRGGVRQDHFDISKIDADRHGAGSL